MVVDTKQSKKGISFERIKGILQTAWEIIYINLFCFKYCFVHLFSGKGSPYNIFRDVKDIFNPHMATVKQSKPLRPGKTMFYANHRSWSDFFMDGYVTGGSSYLSRYGVILGVPGPCLCGYLFNFVWFFHRKRGIDRNWFTEFFAKKWSVRPEHGCVCYPEGHRFKDSGYLQLKTGVMEVAYNLKTPAQIVLADGKEQMFDEINFRINKGQQLIFCVSEVLDPKDYKTKEEWFEKMKATWKQTYEYLEKKEGIKEFEGGLPGYDKHLCEDEAILPSHAIYTWTVIVILIAIVMAACFRVSFVYYNEQITINEPHYHAKASAAGWAD